MGWEAVDAILLDLGLSSLQLDDPARGFSFRFDAPLDMRFDRVHGETTAQDLVNNLPAADLAALFFRYGEERQARRIAGAIVEGRPIQSTRQLAELVARVKSEARPRPGAHPSGDQGFSGAAHRRQRRIGAVERVLPLAVELLRPGGRLAVISFHSLEDRIVKQHFRELSTSRLTRRPGMASMGRTAQARVRLVNRKPITPAEEEIEANPRSRSAKLRVVEKLEWA